jgi:7,8-dihydroneopterin aldolase/epimerase/oxygenase
MDTLRITGLEVSARIGVRDWERAVRQQLFIDLEIPTSAATAATNDDLRDALDYGAVARRVREIVSESRCGLIETLAELIATHILSECSVGRVTVVVHKPSAIPGARDTSIEIERCR